MKLNTLVSKYTDTKLQFCKYHLSSAVHNATLNKNSSHYLYTVYCKLA